jgi:hypothetical protein
VDPGVRGVWRASEEGDRRARNDFRSTLVQLRTRESVRAAGLALAEGCRRVTASRCRGCQAEKCETPTFRVSVCVHGPMQEVSDTISAVTLAMRIEMCPAC